MQIYGNPLLFVPSSHIRVLSALDSSWVVNSNNGLHAHGHPHWLQLMLAAAKLLDMAVLLPAHRLPQFQMYRWAFVGNAEPTHLDNNQTQEGTPQTPDFVPHVVRIAKLMDNKFAGSVEAPVRVPGQLLLVVSSVRSLQELHPFFTAMSTHSTASALSDSLQGRTGGLLDIEAIVERDFLERFPAR
uniref:Uncharacterized protein n=1 Tax=Timema cristinae TaxID=61476 RepID=A0A7R9DDC4_TIMCR|nr:unnamed protein product [Timema cristinae]